jgi:hypothetical protein
MSTKKVNSQEEKREDKPVSMGEIAAIVDDRISRRIQVLEEKFTASLDRLAMVVDNNKAAPNMDAKEKEEVAEDVHILLDEEIRNKRSANELAVLQKLLAHTVVDQDTDLKKRLVEISAIVKARMFLLELSEKVGWGVALAYVELFSGDLSLNPKNLHQAVEYSDTLARIRERKPTTKKKSGMVGRVVAKDGSPVYGACFACGDPSHWAKDCPIRKSKSA